MDYLISGTLIFGMMCGVGAAGFLFFSALDDIGREEDRPPFKRGNLVGSYRGKRHCVNHVFKKNGKWMMLVDYRVWPRSNFFLVGCDEVICENYYLIKK